MLGYRSLYHLLYVEVSGSMNLMKSRARLSRKYMVQKKIMDVNSGAKLHGNFLTSAFLGAGLSYEAGSHLTCSSNARMCMDTSPCIWTHQKHHGSVIVRHACYWSYLPVSVWQASCCLPPKRTTHFRDQLCGCSQTQPLDSWVSMEPCGSGLSRG